MNTNPVVTQFTGDATPFFAELDKIKSQLTGFRGEVAATTSQVGDLLKSYLGFEAIKSAVSAVVDATASAQAAQAQLNNALISAKAPVQAASAVYQAYAEQLQHTTTFSAEAVEGVESLLLSFKGLSGQTVKQATQTVLDLSTRMGIDLPEAAKLLGKALSDPEDGLTSLRRAGILFTESQKDQIKAMQDAGDLAGAQGIVLKTLEERFNGAAAAARDTFGGALKGVDNAFHDLLIGGSGFDGASAALNHLTEVLESPEIKTAFAEIIADLAKVIELAAEAAAGLGIIFTGKGGNESVDLDPQILDLRKQRDELKNFIANGGMTLQDQEDQGITLYSEADLKSDQQHLQQIEADLKKLEDRQDELLGLGNFGPGGSALTDVKVTAQRIQPKGADPLNFITGGDPNIDLAAQVSDEASKELDKLPDLLKQVNDAGDAAVKESEDREIAFSNLMDGLRERGLKLDKDAAEERAQTEIEAQKQVQAFIAEGLNAAVSLYSSGDKTVRGIAKLAFAAQKAQAIAETIIQTRQAIMTTYARLGYPWGIPAAIVVGALGAAQVAAIASQNIGGGSGGAASAGGSSANVGGTPNNSVFSNSSSSSASQPQGVTPQNVLQVYITNHGFITPEITDQIIDQLREATDRDVLIINTNSRQAQEIRGS